MEDGDKFTAFVPTPPVMASMVEGAGDYDAATSVKKGGVIDGRRGDHTRVKVEDAVDDLIARYGSFRASAVSELVTCVGERTVRRYLSDMVKEGKLASVPRGRSTTYSAADSGNGLGADS